MMHKVTAFLRSQGRNAWLFYGHLEVYVRRSSRQVPPKHVVVSTFDVANVSSTIPGNGVFTRWLDELLPLLTASGFDVVRIENVQTDRFADYFRKRGWAETNSDTAPCFTKQLKDRRVHDSIQTGT